MGIDAPTAMIAASAAPVSEPATAGSGTETVTPVASPRTSQPTNTATGAATPTPTMSARNAVAPTRRRPLSRYRVGGRDGLGVKYAPRPRVRCSNTMMMTADRMSTIESTIAGVRSSRPEYCA